jgi:hypothetical protein
MQMWAPRTALIVPTPGSVYQTYEPGSYTLSVTSTEAGSGIRAGNEVRFVVE